MADVNIGTLKATLTIDGTQYQIGLQKASQETDKLNTTTANLATSIYVLESAYKYTSQAVTYFTDVTMRAYEEVNMFNRMTGTSVEIGGKWKDMMEKQSMSLSDMTYAFRAFSNNVQSALVSPEGGAASAFKQLGVSILDANGQMKDNNALML